MPNNRKVAIVTGGSSGIGRATCAALAREGVAVWDLSRRNVPQDGVNHITCDVTNEESVRSAIDRISCESGSIDILLCCAGFGISGAVEFTNPEDSRRQLEVNLFGTDRVVRLTLSHLRRSRGRIVLVSSVAAVAAIPFQTWYSVSKSAINAYALALRNEVRSFGVTVTAVMPGDISTGFTDARNKSTAGDDVYGGRISRSVAGMEKDERSGMSPEIAGSFLSRAALSRSAPALRTIGLGYQLLVFLIKILPASVANFVIGKLYGG